MNRLHVLCLAVFGMLAFQPPALANSGAVLGIAAGLHLVLGNLLIGVGEGLLLAQIYRLSRLKCVATMILANYFSSWIGGLVILPVFLTIPKVDLNNGWFWFWVMVVVAYAMTLVLEYPFIYWRLAGRQNRVRSSMEASLITQSASYIVIFAWYWMNSRTTTFTEFGTVSPDRMSMPKDVIVYYFDSKDGDVYQARLNGSRRQRVFQLTGSRRGGDLFVEPGDLDTNRWNVVANSFDPIGLDYWGHPTNWSSFVVGSNLLAETIPHWFDDERHPYNPGLPHPWGYAGQLGTATNSPGRLYVEPSAGGGMYGSVSRNYRRIHFAYNSPFGSWKVRNAVRLPSDQILFQLGNDQICLLDPATRQVALLWRGRCPLPILELEP
jgi:hypothetical protein